MIYILPSLSLSLSVHPNCMSLAPQTHLPLLHTSHTSLHTITPRPGVICVPPPSSPPAVYLCKRTMQNKARLELADYEAENLARLQKMFSRKWEFIFMQVSHFYDCSFYD